MARPLRKKTDADYGKDSSLPRANQVVVAVSTLMIAVTVASSRSVLKMGAHSGKQGSSASLQSVCGLHWQSGWNLLDISVPNDVVCVTKIAITLSCSTQDLSKTAKACDIELTELSSPNRYRVMSPSSRFCDLKNVQNRCEAIPCFHDALFGSIEK
jgi:hypothetical protein